ncbi:MAG TPA: hypothetical protein VLH86_05930 [Patescibacteria group bacterium]|nr:hypothetical protein [Patescibacteria group bacterium]
MASVGDLGEGVLSIVDEMEARLQRAQAELSGDDGKGNIEDRALALGELVMDSSREDVREVAGQVMSSTTVAVDAVATALQALAIARQYAASL